MPNVRVSQHANGVPVLPWTVRVGLDGLAGIFRPISPTPHLENQRDYMSAEKSTFKSHHLKKKDALIVSNSFLLLLYMR